jgi:hypothetical protein
VVFGVVDFSLLKGYSSILTLSSVLWTMFFKEWFCHAFMLFGVEVQKFKEVCTHSSGAYGIFSERELPFLELFSVTHNIIQKMFDYRLAL